ncbi:prolyl oligopeptidase family serine peptidase [Roseococcus thiosulfatophilus]|uniref:prolyl oligopeptidase family serine peptidase n=1 Tax=Roseococcus thiosulfatophilus TaxID=35813 RepID=UPI001A905128|nr:prolyl oligopeptidase family serine peptidase [Roseococcus thiosulfatophilus]
MTMQDLPASRRRALLSGVLGTALVTGLSRPYPIRTAQGQTVEAAMPAISYPHTRRTDVVEERFGRRIADPYRWLENDARSDGEVAAWMAAQDRTSRAYLATLPARASFHERLTSLYDHERLTAPQQRGGRYFFTRHAGLINQAMLIMREGLEGPDHVLIDPNAWSSDGTTALAEWSASEDGRLVAFGVQEAGSDWRKIRVLDVATGTLLEDEIAHARFTTIAWAKDGSGFFYSGFPAPADETPSAAPVSGHAVHFHALGTAQANDRVVHATPDQPHLVHVVTWTEDGRHAAIFSSPGSGGSTPTIVDLTRPGWPSRTLVSNFDHFWAVIGCLGTTVILVTQQGAPRSRIVTLDLAAAAADFVELVPEQDGTLSDAVLLGGRLVVSYMVDAKTEVRRYRLDGTPDGAVALPGIGTAGGFRGHLADNEAFFTFTSFNSPTTIHRYDVSANASTIWAQPDVTVDARIVVDQRFYASKDGTRVPMFLLRRADITGPAPTMLHVYGGYGLSVVPMYSPALLAWVERGGIVAVANIRGGGEYGRAWHDAGRLLAKQNSFDDVIAAGEFLKAEGIAAPEGLAIQGSSNAGMIVGAVVNQRPDLFAAALPGVGVMDMLRFDRFTGGRLWVNEFGDPAEEVHFRNLLGYSPYHNIRSGAAYPAILVTTADADDRVVPAHSFKYVAALQAADIGDRPRLLRVDTRAGHGTSKPIPQLIEELTDMLAFAARWTGLA